MGLGVAASLHSLIHSGFLPSAYFRFDDELYQDLCKFILNNKGKGFTLSWPPGEHTSLVQSTNYRRKRITPEIWWPNGHEGQKDVYYEKFGHRVFYHNGTLFMLDVHPKHRRQSMQAGSAGLRALALNNKPIKALLQEVWDTRQNDNGERLTDMYAAVEGFDSLTWELSARKSVRRLDTVNINNEDRDKLVADCSNYLADSTRQWYQKRGIPYRRGYLFCGAPGTGKSSLSLALAGYFELDLYQLQLSNPDMNDSNLAILFQELPRRSILLLEDIDSAGLTREVAESVNTEFKPKKKKRGGVTLSGLLNALDGASAPEGHILIMSTNHPENLDLALVRAGRIDYIFEFKLADRQMTKDIFVRMMREDSKPIDEELLEQAETFANHIPEGMFAPATLQGYLLEHIGKTDEALENIGEWVKKAVEDAAKKAKGEEEMVREDEHKVKKETKITGAEATTKAKDQATIVKEEAKPAIKHVSRKRRRNLGPPRRSVRRRIH